MTTEKLAPEEKTILRWHQYFDGLKQRNTYVRGWGLQQTCKTTIFRAVSVVRRINKAKKWTVRSSGLWRRQSASVQFDPPQRWKKEHEIAATV